MTYLCDDCHAMFSSPQLWALDRTEFLDFDRTWEGQVIQNLECLLCKSMWKKMPFHPRTGGRMTVQCKLHPAKTSMLIGFKQSDDESPLEGRHGDFTVYAPFWMPDENNPVVMKINPATEIIASTPPNLDVASDAAFKWARNCLNHCDKNDMACQRTNATVPLRLLDISDIGNGGMVRLHTFSFAQSHDWAAKAKVRFAALSYCWGSSKFLTTNSQNIRSHHQGIAINHLPRTIQDAIFCTFKLGLNYIWVDSLCIMQDDEVEKATEIGRMDEFYNAAYLTISAASAENAYLGFTEVREPHPDAISIQFTCPSGAAGSIELVEKSLLYSRATRPEPTATRAWIMQESMLSRRQLIYSSQQLFWLCRCQFSGHGGDTSFRDFQRHTSWPMPLWSSREISTALFGIKDEFPEWTDIVTAFSQRSLSYQADKLPAMSAIAKQYQSRRTEDEYVAGLWRRELAHGLCWKSNVKPGKRVEPPSTSMLVGPSWSWAAFNGPVVWDVPSPKDLRKMVTVNAIRKRPRFYNAPLGQMESASVVIDAPLLEIIPMNPEDNTSPWLRDVDFSLFDNEDCNTQNVMFSLDYPYHLRLGSRARFYCLILKYISRETGQARGSVCGIVLFAQGDMVFERVGAFEVGVRSFAVVPGGVNVECLNMPYHTRKISNQTVTLV